MRLFAAVDVDDATRGDIAQLSDALRQRHSAAGLGKASWVQKDRMHLTLHFVADADAPTEARVRAAFDQPFPMAPFDLSFRGIGFFPERGSPRVLWLGIDQGLDPLRALHREFQRRLGASTKSREGFSPHLTLARFRDRVPRARMGEIAQFSASAGPCRIDRVTLYESRLSPKGPTYTVLAQAPLKT
jgi:2'-5' RNA ligase